MAISLASLRTTSALTPPRILIHGVAGVGKSTFAAAADRPVFIMTEDGLGRHCQIKRP
jgi:2-phosphoglycerate kinase